MFEIGLKSLLERASNARTLNSCLKYARQLNSMKNTIERLGGMDKTTIDQLNSIDLMLSKIQRKVWDGKNTQSL